MRNKADGAIGLLAILAICALSLASAELCRWFRMCAAMASREVQSPPNPHAGLMRVLHQPGTRQATLRSTGIDGTRPGAELSDIPA